MSRDPSSTINRMVLQPAWVNTIDDQPFKLMRHTASSNWSSRFVWGSISWTPTSSLIMIWSGVKGKPYCVSFLPMLSLSLGGHWAAGIVLSRDLQFHLNLYPNGWVLPCSSVDHFLDSMWFDTVTPRTKRLFYMPTLSDVRADPL